MQDRSAGPDTKRCSTGNRRRIYVDVGSDLELVLDTRRIGFWDLDWVGVIWAEMIHLIIYEND
ncbi:hypothetical protein PanWU01x14_248620 [Parasponia andersonii]|uniref:Uncharacterized protein n=1 Tax=Parasponia andersonii TaxID=3476 RepID=A0A2P5BDL9_PARAD|nr:hypothetical protein PanWU01x14_248620 [Parasponia andersonii]